MIDSDFAKGIVTEWPRRVFQRLGELLLRIEPGPPLLGGFAMNFSERFRLRYSLK
jgi:hypothetical protein